MGVKNSKSCFHHFLYGFAEDAFPPSAPGSSSVNERLGCEATVVFFLLKLCGRGIHISPFSHLANTTYCVLLETEDPAVRKHL